MFEKVKKWWETFHNKEMILNAYKKGKITAAEYTAIVGEEP